MAAAYLFCDGKAGACEAKNVSELLHRGDGRSDRARIPIAKLELTAKAKPIYL